jgi:LuxR family quorum-sensing system transcriptional regulator CciR
MTVDVEEFIRRLQAIGECDAVVPLRQATMNALALFGITRGYFVAPMTRDPRVGRILTNWGLPWTWEKQYREKLYLSDPLPDLAMDRLSAVVWPDDLDARALTSRQVRCMEVAKEQGLGRGVGVACFGPNGRSGFLGAVLDDNAPKPSGATLQRLHAIGQTSFQTYCRLIQRVEEMPNLSNRELEVLHWIGRGKSNSIIADILGISPSSVDVYVRRIFTKLDVTDRTSATLKAFAQGLLVSGDYERFVEESRQRHAAEDSGDATVSRTGPPS